MSETENVQRVIIDKDSITLEFDTEGNTSNIIIWGKTPDGRTAIYLSEDTDIVSKKAAMRKASRQLGVLKKDNPGVDIEIVKGTSVFAPRGTEALLAIGHMVVKSLEMMLKGEVKSGHNAIKLAGLSPIANTSWNAFWAILNKPLSELNIANFANQK